MENNIAPAKPDRLLLFERLLADVDLVEQLTSEGFEWEFQPDASYDDGCWMDESRWIRRDVEIYGQRVTLYAKPEYDGKYNQIISIGEICSIDIVGGAR